MRLIGTFHDQKKAEFFIRFLGQKQIDAELQGHPEVDAESWRVWVYDDDHIEEARKYFEQYESEQLQLSFDPKPIGSTPELFDSPPPKKKVRRKQQVLNHFFTYLLLFTCIAIHLFTYWPEMSESRQIKREVFPKKTLFYDTPKAFEPLYQKLSSKNVKRTDHFELPDQKTYWNGIQEELKAPNNQPRPPMFEKILQGEIWRLFTPSLLHGNLLHLLFNMIWLLVLGSQIEKKVGGLRFLFLTLLASAVSNTLQYLVAGSFFLGFSGVALAYIFFVRERQIQFPWEGYQLQSSTFAFVCFYLGVTLLAEVMSFVLSEIHLAEFSLQIANTAHFSGLLVGYLIAKFKFMKIRD